MVLSLNKVPNRPAIYAMDGHSVGHRPVAYVGQAGKLRTRLRQHLVLRDSSVTTGTSVVSLNPDLVRAVEWWEHDGFDDNDVLGAAELVAFDVLDPVLRSRGHPTSKAVALAADRTFRKEFAALFSNSATGSLSIETLPELSARVDALTARVGALETQITQPKRLPRP